MISPEKTVTRVIDQVQEYDRPGIVISCVVQLTHLVYLKVTGRILLFRNTWYSQLLQKHDPQWSHETELRSSWTETIELAITPPTTIWTKNEESIGNFSNGTQRTKGNTAAILQNKSTHCANTPDFKLPNLKCIQIGIRTTTDHESENFPTCTPFWYPRSPR